MCLGVRRVRVFGVFGVLACSGLACSGLFGAGALGALCARVRSCSGCSGLVLCVRALRSCVRAVRGVFGAGAVRGWCCSGLVLFGAVRCSVLFGRVGGWRVAGGRTRPSGLVLHGAWRPLASARLRSPPLASARLRSPPLARVSAVGRCLDLSRRVGCSVHKNAPAVGREHRRGGCRRAMNGGLSIGLLRSLLVR